MPKSTSTCNLSDMDFDPAYPGCRTFVRKAHEFDRDQCSDDPARLADILPWLGLPSDFKELLADFAAFRAVDKTMNELDFDCKPRKERTDADGYVEPADESTPISEHGYPSYLLMHTRKMRERYPHLKTRLIRRVQRWRKHKLATRPGA